MIKAHTTRTGQPDEISQVLGCDGYYYPYYDRKLRDLVLGEHSPDLISVTRFYPTLLPPVIVDFEPQKPDKMYCDEKRKFFMNKGYVYIPIFLGEVLSKDQFAARYKEEKENLVRGHREKLEDEVLQDKTEIPMFTDAQELARIDAEALKIVQEMGLRGAAKNKRLRREKERLIQEAARARMGSSGRSKPATISTR